MRIFSSEVNECVWLTLRVFKKQRRWGKKKSWTQPGSALCSTHFWIGPVIFCFFLLKKFELFPVISLSLACFPTELLLPMKTNREIAVFDFCKRKVRVPICAREWTQLFVRWIFLWMSRVRVTSQWPIPHPPKPMANSARITWNKRKLGRRCVCSAAESFNKKKRVEKEEQKEETNIFFCNRILVFCRVIQKKFWRETKFASGGIGNSSSYLIPHFLLFFVHHCISLGRILEKDFLWKVSDAHTHTHTNLHTHSLIHSFIEWPSPRRSCVPLLAP